MRRFSVYYDILRLALAIDRQADKVFQVVQLMLWLMPMVINAVCIVLKCVYWIFGGNVNLQMRIQIVCKWNLTILWVKSWRLNRKFNNTS